MGDAGDMPPPRPRNAATTHQSVSASGYTVAEQRYLRDAEVRVDPLADERLFLADTTLPVSRSTLTQASLARAGGALGMVTRDAERGGGRDPAPPRRTPPRPRHAERRGCAPRHEP